jgi:hypothetical protein
MASPVELRLDRFIRIRRGAVGAMLLYRNTIFFIGIPERQGRESTILVPSGQWRGEFQNKCFSSSTCL